MVTDLQVRRLLKLLNEEKSINQAALKAGMDEKTARKYRDAGKLPSQLKVEHIWKTRKDPYEEFWDGVEENLIKNPGLQAKTLFEDLQRRYPGKFPDGQLRTLQRKIKRWRALDGPAKEVFFPQVHKPGKLCQSDFTRMAKLGITINGQSFEHMIYHFVLTYSNWETGTICFSESYESLSEGLQNALFELGGVPRSHRTDSLSSAVRNLSNPKEFTQRYKALLSHYRLNGEKIGTGKPNENGDVEQSHRRFKSAMAQALMLRGSRDFANRTEYEIFMQSLFKQLNSNRDSRFQEELKVLKELPAIRLNDCKRVDVRVTSFSTINVQSNLYSVHSRLIGEMVSARIYAERIEVWYAQKLIDTIPRIRGRSKHSIQYRHIIDWLVRKPGAFENYRYRDDLFPTSRFRMAYDSLKANSSSKANSEYLKILYLASKESQTKVDSALRKLIYEETPIGMEAVESILQSDEPVVTVSEVIVDDINLLIYDELLENREVLV